MYARMVIGEAISEEHIREFRSIFMEEAKPAMLKVPGAKSAGILVEDGGTMLVVLTAWETREDCVRYYASKTYREFVSKTQHLLLGNFVVKAFRVE